MQNPRAYSGVWGSGIASSKGASTQMLGHQKPFRVNNPKLTSVSV